MYNTEYSYRKVSYDLYFILIGRTLNHNVENKINKFYIGLFLYECCLSILGGIGFNSHLECRFTRLFF